MHSFNGAMRRGPDSDGSAQHASDSAASESEPDAGAAGSRVKPVARVKLVG